MANLFTKEVYGTLFNIHLADDVLGIDSHNRMNFWALDFLGFDLWKRANIVQYLLSQFSEPGSGVGMKFQLERLIGHDLLNQGTL